MKQRTIGYLGAIALAMAPLVSGQEQPPVPEPPREDAPAAPITIQERHVEGEVVEVNAQRLTVQTDDGRRMTFSVDRDLTVGVEPITVGSRVRVDYRGEQQFEVVNVSRLSLESDPDNGADAARVETSRTQPPATPPASERDELPGTASPLPMLLAAGLALLGSGLGLSSRRRA